MYLNLYIFLIDEEEVRIKSPINYFNKIYHLNS